MSDFAKKILNWHSLFGRKNLPWQQDISPYKVWVSEIMLQQTQVATVIPYFERFMSVFPTVFALAKASIDQVLHYWSGLGYYARARHLYQTAQIICNQYQQQFPMSLTLLMQLPGIGRSTAGAILSIAFKKKATILDGNVKRVLTRHHAIVGYPGNKKVENLLWQLAEEHTPETNCHIYTQAIMDLGATLCTRTTPSCHICPLQGSCKAYLNNMTKEFPTKKVRAALPLRTTCLLILENEIKQFYFEKRPNIGLWGGLWSFPECEEIKIEQYCKDNHLHILSKSLQPKFRHTFTHFHLEITPVILMVRNLTLSLNENNGRWLNPLALPAIGLTTPVKKILQFCTG